MGFELVAEPDLSAAESMSAISTSSASANNIHKTMTMNSIGTQQSLIAYTYNIIYKIHCVREDAHNFLEVPVHQPLLFIKTKFITENNFFFLLILFVFHEVLVNFFKSQKKSVVWWLRGFYPPPSPLSGPNHNYVGIPLVCHKSVISMSKISLNIHMIKTIREAWITNIYLLIYFFVTNCIMTECHRSCALQCNKRSILFYCFTGLILPSRFFAYNQVRGGTPESNEEFIPGSIWI